MTIRFLLHFLVLVTIGSLSVSFSYGKTLDHELFLQEMKNGSNFIYSQCIAKYDDYLTKFPKDVAVHIEKCKFIQFAQYDDYEEYNPNQDDFDSCVNFLAKQFPIHPDVILFQTSYL